MEIESTRYEKLKKRFDCLHETFDYATRIDNDPVKFVRGFSSPADIEVAGLLSSCLAYGRVELIIRALSGLFERMGESPSDFAKKLNSSGESCFDGFRYRLWNADDIRTLLWSAGKVQNIWGTLENLFMEEYSGFKEEQGGFLRFRNGLEHFSKTFLSIAEESPFTERKNFSRFFPFPSKGSACKRLCLFTRWMVRPEPVDLGIWKKVNTAHLVIPVDAHISRIGKYLGLTRRKSPSWKMAVEITESLKKLDSEDPLRYDFLICHMGISGEWKNALETLFSPRSHGAHEEKDGERIME
ncbi:MAG: TIGR02757 family protein [Candidatus Eremiobacteraeota bacterium]|nr:TIGR02757 family protein [Candidatus Eremiobacteraeota bacterium]